MKILIIGGTGLLSGAVAAHAVNMGYDVTCLNRGKHSIIYGTHQIISDKDNYDQIREKLSGTYYDTIIDFLVRRKDELQRSYEFYSNYTNQYVLISSTMVYDSSKSMIFDEASPKVQSMWSYSVEKWECEQLLIKLVETSNCKYTIIRPGITYDNTRIPYSVMPPYGKHWTLVERMKAGKPIVAINNGANRCNMMRVEDFAVGVVGLIGNEKAYNETYNVCGDESPSFKQVLDSLASILGLEYSMLSVSAEKYAEIVPARKGEIMGRSFNYVCTNNKIKKIVPNFSSQIPLTSGLQRVVCAYKENDYQQGIDFVWDAECDKVVKAVTRESPRFVDYLKTATIDDKITYYQILGNNVCVICYCFLRKINKIITKLSRKLNG